jgi:GR25 family glycosyltransferase involved in LPS biosynthesis
MTLMTAVSNLTVSWVEGVTGDHVLPQALPVDAQENRKLQSAGARGSWRSHMNALRTVVEQGLESALILEDDVDWDARLKSQLETFALAAGMWSEESDHFEVSFRHRYLWRQLENAC